MTIPEEIKDLIPAFLGIFILDLSWPPKSFPWGLRILMFKIFKYFKHNYFCLFSDFHVARRIIIKNLKCSVRQTMNFVRILLYWVGN